MLRVVWVWWTGEVVRCKGSGGERKDGRFIAMWPKEWDLSVCGFIVLVLCGGGRKGRGEGGTGRKKGRNREQRKGSWCYGGLRREKYRGYAVRMR